MTAKRKQDSAPLKMVKETWHGRPGLFPRAPYDAERLDSYRDKSEVNVRITNEKQHPLIKKWWIVLGQAIENARTPWKTAEEASEDIKLALGMTAKVLNTSGNWEYHTISLSDIESEDELQVYYELMLDVVYQTTGLDVDTLKDLAKKKASAPEQEDENTEPASVGLSPADGEASGRVVPPGTAAGSCDGGHPLPAAVAPPSLDPMRECITKMLDIATKERPNEPLTKADREVILKTAQGMWIAFTNREAFVNRVYEVCIKVLNGDATRARAEQYLEGLVR